jgi:benzoate/toluate 1,2-dioxygenase beta subunit
MSSSIDERITELLYLEASLLDERRYDSWLELYATELEYWVPIRADQQSPLDEVSLFYEDRTTLEFRVKRLTHPDIHIQMPPSRTCRQVTNIMRLGPKDCVDSVEYQSKLVLHEYRPHLAQQCFAATCFHTFLIDGDVPKIRKKRVVLINSDAALSPLSFPF